MKLTAASSYYDFNSEADAVDSMQIKNSRERVAADYRGEEHLHLRHDAIELTFVIPARFAGKTPSPPICLPAIVVVVDTFGCNWT
ncbi:hypothetical protein Bca52824_015090 [Brassica carinata]|uniref:Uncharacterized protein n=1 Tax=Brassica carinata TaxID=52824 RepID=A0A8X8B523_BRACI|nr:hypothetical protein Bca52824_015090 [Brassica carinata]